MTMMPGLDDDSGKQLIADTLRAYVGQGKRFSWRELAEATGDNERTLRSYVEGVPSNMPATTLFRVFAALPPQAFGRICRRMGFASPKPLEAEDEASVRRALTGVTRFAAEASAAIEDGELNHQERARLGLLAEEIIPTLTIVADRRV